MWEILFSNRFERNLKKLDRPVVARIYEALDRLAVAENPQAQCKALTGNLSGLWRYRVGDYRFILDIQQGQVVILALDVGHRSRIY